MLQDFSDSWHQIDIFDNVFGHRIPYVGKEGERKGCCINFLNSWHRFSLANPKFMSDTPVCSDSHITLSLALSIALFSFALSLPRSFSLYIHLFFCVYLVSVNICHSLSLSFSIIIIISTCLQWMYLSTCIYLPICNVSIYLSIYSVSPSQTHFQLCSLSSVNLLSGPKPHFVLSPKSSGNLNSSNSPLFPLFHIIWMWLALKPATAINLSPNLGKGENMIHSSSQM